MYFFALRTATPIPIRHPNGWQNCSTLLSGLAERRGVGGRVAAVPTLCRDLACCLFFGSSKKKSQATSLRHPQANSDKLENMKLSLRSALFCLFFFFFGALALPAFAQEGPLENIPPKDATPEEIIKRFAAKEKEFQQARDQYTYRQEVRVMTVDGETVTGEYREVFDVLFDDKGKRVENVVFAPQSTLEQGNLSMDQGDFEDIRHRLPFVLTSDEIGEYNILY